MYTPKTVNSLGKHHWPNDSMAMTNLQQRHMTYANYEHTTMSMDSIGTEAHITNQQQVWKHFLEFLYSKNSWIISDISCTAIIIL